MLLTSTSDILRIVTSSTADIDIQAAWADVTTSAFTPGRTNTKVTSATTTTIISSPGASTQRQIKKVVIRNVHAATDNDVTIQHYDGTTSVTVYKATLAAGESIVYTEGGEFIPYDANGNPPTGSGGGGLSDGDYGDITVSGTGTVLTIDANAVTLAKLATQAANTILAEATGGVAVPTAVAIAANKFLARASAGNLAAKDITDFALTLLDDADASTMRTTLGLAIGTNVQAYDAELAAVAGLTSAANKIIRFTGSGTADLLDFSTDGTMASNSDSLISSQKAVKTYVDTAVTGLLDFKGSTDASSNPNYPAASKGDAYVVSVAGKVGGASGKSVDVGDIYLATADNAGGTEASVGTSWTVLEHNLVGALLAANNLNDLASATTALTNLGLTANGKSLVTAADYAAMKVLLSLTIGTNVQAWDADLDYLAGFTPTANVKSILNAADYAAIKTLMGLVIGTNVQAWDADLDYLAGFTPTANVKSILNAADYAAIKTLLSLTIGTNVQAYDADLTTWAGLTPSANAQSLVTAADYAAMKVLLGLTIGTNVQAYDADLTTWAGLTPSANAQSLVTAADYAAMLTLLFGVALPENTAIILDAALSADGKYSGIVEAGTAGATLAFGDLVYLQTSDSRWELVDANAEATCKNKLGMCVLAAAADGSATTILLMGKIRADAAFPALTIGAPVFAGTTAGDIQTTAPSGTLDIIRIIGYGNTADELYFNPSNDYFEHV